jgi:site-specific recombinase XerD
MEAPVNGTPLTRSEAADPERFTRLQALVLDGVRSAHSRRAYAKGLEDFFSWYGREPRAGFTRATVQAYRAWLETAGLAPSTINVRLAAVRKLASEAAENGLLETDVAGGILRLKGVRSRGVRMGNWLTLQQTEELLGAPDGLSLKGKRDRAMLALLAGCGLRRSELIALTLDRLQQREGRWVIVDLVGKGSRLRTVPVPGWVKTFIDDWTTAAAVGEGRVFRAVNKAGAVGGQITEKAVWWIVQEYAAQIGVERIGPHDLRRTCAKLCRAAGGDLEQIQFLLGHASIQTTERYLGSRQDLAEAVNDRVVFTAAQRKQPFSS